jgi:hypothetical protein
MARILVIAPDLLFGSRIEVALSSAGHEVTLAPAMAEGRLESADMLIADLERENPEALVGMGVPVIGYYPHVDSELRAVAEAAGVDIVVPRSRMAREMAELVERALAESAQ